MNEQASILFNISSSFSGHSTWKVGLSAPHFCLQRALPASLARNLYTQQGFELLGRQLATIARQAYFARQMDTVEQASQLMLALPLSKEQTAIAHYYHATCVWNRGLNWKIDQIIEAVSPDYQAQGLFSIATILHRQGRIEAALPEYLAAARAAGQHDPLVFAASQKMVAVIRSIYGDHQQALNDLEQLFPLVRAIAKYCPAFYYDFLNSYAVELGETGRLEEGRAACAIVVASPFATAYPEFIQTHDELAAKRTAATPSINAVPAAPEIIPSADAATEAKPPPARARSTIFIKLRRVYSLARLLTRGSTAKHAVVSACAILDQLAYSTLPRSPPAQP